MSMKAAIRYLRSCHGLTASGPARDRAVRMRMVLLDPDWESKSGHYRVRVANEWIDVPDDAVITEPNRAGRTMVWPIKGTLGTSIRCFVLGSMT
jgi:hypothetical protein